MSLKTEFIEEKREVVQTFPCTMKHNSTGIVVLFFSSNAGVVVEANDPNFMINQFSDEWALCTAKHYWTRVHGTTSFKT